MFFVNLHFSYTMLVDEGGCSMKKLLLGLLIPVVILVGGATTLFLLVRNTSSPSYQKTSQTSEEVMNHVISDAFASTRESKKISFSMGQDDFNQLLALSFDSVDESVKEYVKGLEVKVDKDVYHIYCYAKASILDTRLDLACKFSDDENNYYLTIDSIKVGSLPVKSIAFFALEKVMPASQMDAFFKQSGLEIKSDYANKRFVYEKESAKKDLLSLLKKGMQGNALISSAVENLFEMDLLTIDYTSHIAVDIDLSPLQTNSDFVDSNNVIKEEDFGLDKNKEYIKTLLENGTIDEAENHPSYVMDFLLKGYSFLKDDEKQYIDSLNLESIGISELEKKTYSGYQPDSIDIKESVLSSVTKGSLISEEGFLISEKSLNGYLQEQGVLGYNYIFTSKQDNSYVVNYIALDNAYFNLITQDGKQQMNMVFGVNINGCETSLILENTKTADLNYGMTLTNENIYFGTKKVSDSLKNSLYEMIHDNLPQNEFLTFDGNGKFVINFEGYLKDYISNLENTTKKTLKLSTAIEGTSIQDEKAGLRLKGQII